MLPLRPRSAFGAVGSSFCPVDSLEVPSVVPSVEPFPTSLLVRRLLVKVISPVGWLSPDSVPVVPFDVPPVSPSDRALLPRGLAFPGATSGFSATGAL